MTSSGYSFRNGFIAMSAPAKLVLLVAMVVFCLIAGMILAFLIAKPLFNLDYMGMLQVMSNPGAQNLAVLRYFQVFQTIVVFLLPALIVSWLISPNTFDFLRLSKGSSVIIILIVILSIITVTPLMNALMQLNSALDLPVWLDTLEQKIIMQEKAAAHLTELFLSANTFWDLAFNFLMIAILPALAEEILFRGVLQRLLGEWTGNFHIGIILTAFTFSFIHFQFFGFLPRFLLGLYFGYLFFWTRSLWVPIIAHLANNGMAVVYYFLSSEKVGETKLDTLGTESHYLVYLSVFITCLLAGSIYIRAKDPKSA